MWGAEMIVFHPARFAASALQRGRALWGAEIRRGAATRGG